MDQIWILVTDWSRFKSSEPNADHVTRKIGPLYFTLWSIFKCFPYFLFSNWKLQNWFCPYPRARPKSLPPPGANFPFLLLLETLQSPGLHNGQHDKKFKKREEKLNRGGNSWFKPSGSFEAEPSFLRFSIARSNVFSELYKSQRTGNCQSIIEIDW